MEILIILLLTLLNGFFSLSEIALVSVKRSRIRSLADKGDRRARIILRLRDEPELFLSSVQVGITLIGIVAGAYGGANLTDDLVPLLSGITWLGDQVYTVSLVIVIGTITYFTIVIGELVPKSIALNSPEKVALVVAPLIRGFSFIAMPIVKVLGASTTFLLRLIGIKQGGGDRLSEDELRAMLRTANLQGVLETQETEAHHNLFRFTDQVAKTLMTHRNELEWIDSERPLNEIIDQVRASVHSKFPVCRGSMDDVVGILTIRDLLDRYNDPTFTLEDVVHRPIFIPQSTPAFSILNSFRRQKQYAALVIDEHGQLRGMVTLHDLTEAIMGDLPDLDEDDGPDLVQRRDGSWLANGQVLVGDLNQKLDKELIDEDNNAYTTVAGFVLNQLERIPKAGDKVETGTFTCEVMDMDGNRIDKILITLHDDEGASDPDRNSDH